MNFFNIHNHTEYSNLALRDCIIKPKDLIITANEKKYKGVAITDHEALSSHVKANKIYNELKKSGEIAEDFKLGLGNEIYLVDDNIKEKVANNKYVKYYHFLLLAKDRIGYEGISELSSIANKESYFAKGLERRPTYKSDFVRVMKKYKGHIIVSTACLGGELATLCDKVINETDKEYKKKYKIKINNFLKGLIKLVGKENVFIEIHPTLMDEGKKVNKMLYKLSEVYGITPVTATDTHYLLRKHAIIHETYLKASNGEREVAQFYATTFLHDREDFLLHFSEFEEDVIDKLINNTMSIYDMIEDIDLSAKPQIPKAKISVPTDLKEIFKPYINKYKNIKRYYENPDKVPQELINLCAQGFIKLKQEFNDENLSRFDKELSITDEISKNLEQDLAEYFLSMYDLMNIAWEVSYVGPGRGSGVAWYINYLLEITQLNPIKNDLPEWRFMDASRVELD